MAEGNRTDGFNFGDLKRRLDTVPLLKFGGVGEAAGVFNRKIRLEGLQSVLDVQVFVGIIGVDGAPIRAANYPANPGTWQLTPVTNFGDQPKGFGRPVFQDPTSVDNKNNPLPQDIPYAYNFPAESDQAEIEVDIPDLSEYDGSELRGMLVAQCMVEYVGDWWDVAAIQYALSKVRFSGPKIPDTAIPTTLE